MSLLPEYEEAVNDCWRESVDLLMRARDPLFAKIPRAPPAPHIPAAASTTETSKGYQGELQPIEGMVAFNVDDFLNCRVEAWSAAVSECADSTLPQVMKGIFASLKEATSQAGNVVDAAGKPLSHDIFLDALEKMELDFDSEGRFKNLTLVVPPPLFEKVQSLGPLSAEQQARYDGIIKHKWEAHLARRRVRKLDK